MGKNTKQKIKHDIFYTAENVHGKFHSFMLLSPGAPELTPTATQWALKVRLTINDSQPEFDMMENIFRSFLTGTFCGSINTHKYEQTDSGFTVVFAPSELPYLGGGQRREMKSIHVSVKLGQKPGITRNKAFGEVLDVLDHGFTAVMKNMAEFAPLIFDDITAKKLRSVMPLIRPLRVILQLASQSNELEQVVERGLIQTGQPPPHLATATPVSAAKRRKTGPAQQISKPASLEPQAIYFPAIDFELRKFMVIADDGICVHEPCFFNNFAVK